MTSEERRSFLLSMTLTELALILFFLLLLLSVFRLREKEEVIQDLVGGNAKLASVLPAVTRWVEANEDQDFQTLVRTAERAAETQKVLEKRVSQLESEKERLAREAAEAAARNDQLEQSCDNLGGQLKHCQRMAKGGHGFPPCWADSDGKAEYIYRIEVREDDVGVQAHWPEHRADDVERLPGARELLSPSIQMADFRRRASPLLEWSKTQDPECRFYVVLDDAASTKDGYKKKRLAIEDYFFKYEVRP